VKAGKRRVLTCVGVILRIGSVASNRIVRSERTMSACAFEIENRGRKRALDHAGPTTGKGSAGCHRARPSS
jgi:hypothetical protein